MTSTLAPISIEARFLAKVQKSDGCWNWTASVKPNGYGQFAPVNRIPRYAHRVAYELWVGPIPPDRQIDHLCRNKRCVNPAHLDLVTASENTFRSPLTHSGKMVCKRGHPFDLFNTMMERSGNLLYRRCRACREQQRLKRGG